MSSFGEVVQEAAFPIKDIDLAMAGVWYILVLLFHGKRFGSQINCATQLWGIKSILNNTALMIGNLVIRLLP